MARDFSRWFRFYDSVLDDPKVQRLSDHLFRAWVNLMCIASRNGGRISSDFKDIAFSLRLTEGKARDTIQALISGGLIVNNETDFAPHNWEGRQFQSDVSTERVKRFRKRQETVSGNGHAPLDETVPETDTESDTEQNREREKGATPSADAAPPSRPKRVSKKSPQVEAGINPDTPEGAAADYWNGMAEDLGLAQVRHMTATRREKVLARISELGGMVNFAMVLDQIPKSPFLQGKNDRGWRVDFDWVLEPRNLVKISEGKFENGHA